MDDEYDDENEAECLDEILMQEERAALEELDTINSHIRNCTLLWKNRYKK